MILDIHLEKCDDDGERLEKILDLGKPIIISLVPVLMLPNHEVFKERVYPSHYFYPKRFINILKEHSHDKNLLFGQQGFAHYCIDCFSKREERDPWHENKCLYNKTRSVKEQKKFMGIGKVVIEKTLGISPKLYVPPNHQFDKNTLKASEKLDFRYFVIRNKMNIKPYREGKLIIFPENDLDEGGEVIYIHYDEMKDDLDRYLDVIRNSSSIQDIKPRNQSPIIIADNYNKILWSKKDRDMRKIKK